MKYTKLYAVAMTLIVLVACTAKKETANSVSQELDEWKEMDSFHMIMAEAFHPYKDSSNLEPAKKLAEDMATEAAKWADTNLPEKVNNEDVKQQLQKLKADTRALADLIKNGGDKDAIGNSLNVLHDSFHGIMEAWHGGEEKHEHQH
jgi:Tfp pilus assembly protein PilP